MSLWKRNKAEGTATREDGCRLSIVDSADTGRKWTVVQGGAFTFLSTTPIRSAMEDAILSFDEVSPPLEWSKIEGVWKRQGWEVRAEGMGWVVYRDRGEGMERACKKHFTVADKGRGWVDARLSRRTVNLRGPKPRAGERSTTKLPDVRVTQTEKDDVKKLLAELGMTYSDFARASVAFAWEYVVKEDLFEVQEQDGAPAFIEV